MKLYLLRHGAVEYKAPTGKDFDRALSPLGKQQIENVKDFLKEKEETTAFSAYCSNANRTKETFKIVSTSLKIKKVDYLNELYHADFQFLMKFLSAIEPSEKSVLLVGHNNGISDLASLLLDQRIGFPTGGLIMIDFTSINDWSEIGRGTGEEVGRFFPKVE